MSDLKVRYSVKESKEEYPCIEGKDTYNTIEEASIAVDYILKNIMQKNSKSIKHTGLLMVDTICEDGTVVIGRLDGTFDGEDFFIEIIELQRSIV
ncbi:hypothetical protein [Pseudobacteroides cellulosolvens]|uniref:Uncharacterized protein n=1 Tax=Pseudobacteroides cellulosolvens ATCC 35603 = DSM 2933 TaxID=398512 RepID=A0A0L6JGW2_9FIRM|nr:hypothetical protein [Pseudobacteroides cellulosolvens]KNY24959.1 hypothetical protein Bccel_0216 [Pseudobacteroides cellulosolvens ATCC 35603 = DSM 2933]